MRVNEFSRRVREFHHAFGHPLDVDNPDLNLLALRAKLIREEAGETFEAFSDLIMNLELNKNTENAKANLLKELCDVLVVTFGAAEALGLPIEAAFNRVMSSNMSKLGPDGKPIYREDGKVLKGPNYKAPNLTDLV